MKKLLVDKNLGRVLDAMSEGITIIDAEGKIVFGNQAYCKFIGQKCEDIRGRHLKEIRPSAKLPDVVKTGTKLVHVLRAENEDEYFVNMYPIYEEGAIIGGISILTFVDTAMEFKKEIELLEKKLEKKLLRINKANSAKYTFDSIDSVSQAMAEIKELAQQAAETDITVLLQSETGTGKELFANAIHNASLRKNEVFIAINCANFQSEMLDSELFGYVEGAFTGAKKGGKMGLFEAADGGTLFLDEISEMDLGLQAKLLRALQEMTIRPVGGIKDIPVDVRIICASNANLKDYVNQGKFRADLYYRLSTFPLVIPPLRERRGDVAHITRSKMIEISKKLKKPLDIDGEAIRFLEKYHWPGNVRELVNVLEFSALRAKEGVITLDSLPELVYDGLESDASSKLKDRVKEYERREILKELAKHGQDTQAKKMVAKKLGISLASLYNKINEEF